MMKSYQLSVISCQQSVEWGSAVSRQQTMETGGRMEEGKQMPPLFHRFTLPSLPLKAEGFRWLTAIPLIFLLLFLVSCGDEGLVDPHGETTLPPPETTGFHAIDLPTAPGSAWTYINVDTNQEFTLRVEGTRDISGTTHRQLTISELTTAEPDQFRLEAVDHLVANAYYLRIETEFFDGFPFPIFATYFTKTSQALIESAFDMYLPSIDNPGFLRISHQKHFPPRRLWDFPLESRERVGGF